MDIRQTAPVGAQKFGAGYTWIKMPGHSKARPDGYVMLAVLNWEDFHGKPFPVGHVPHHRNLDRSDDWPENILAITPRQHTKLHRLIEWRPEQAKAYEAALDDRQRWFPPAKEQLASLYRANTLEQIGRVYKVNSGMVAKWLEAAGISRRRTGPR